MGRPQPKTATDVDFAWNRVLELLQQKTTQPEEAYEKVVPLLRPSFFLAIDSKNTSIRAGAGQRDLGMHLQCGGQQHGSPGHPQGVEHQERARARRNG